MVDDLRAFELERGRSAFPAVDQHFVEELVEGALEVCNQSAAGCHNVSVSHDFALIVMQRYDARSSPRARLKPSLATIAIAALWFLCANFFKNCRRHRFLRRLEPRADLRPGARAQVLGRGRAAACRSAARAGNDDAGAGARDGCGRDGPHRRRAADARAEGARQNRGQLCAVPASRSRSSSRLAHRSWKFCTRLRTRTPI